MAKDREQEFPCRMVLLGAAQWEREGAGSRNGLGKGVRCTGLDEREARARARPVWGQTAWKWTQTGGETAKPVWG